MTVTAKNIRRWGAQDSLWLVLAITLHALLLLIPALQKDDTASRTVSLNITLLTPEPTEIPFVGEPESTVNQLPPVRDKTVATDHRPGPELATLEEPKEIADQTPPGQKMILTTAVLLNSVIEMERPVPAVDDPRRLGVFALQALPENWRSGNGNEDIILNPMVLPTRTEIVDRWLALDGSHNVIINTPGGHTLCGRALAWDPIQPLVEHIMLFRLCGGNQKRTLEMTNRIKRLTSSPL